MEISRVATTTNNYYSTLHISLYISSRHPYTSSQSLEYISTAVQAIEGHTRDINRSPTQCFLVYSNQPTNKLNPPPLLRLPRHQDKPPLPQPNPGHPHIPRLNPLSLLHHPYLPRFLYPSPRLHGPKRITLPSTEAKRNAPITSRSSLAKTKLVRPLPQSRSIQKFNSRLHPHRSPTPMVTMIDTTTLMKARMSTCRL